MKFVHLTASLILLLFVSASQQFSQQPSPQRLPIIDVHLHATGWTVRAKPDVA